MKLLMFAAILFCMHLLAASAETPKWVRTYDGPGNSEDEAVAVATDADGNVYVCGWSNGEATGQDWVTLKYNSDGTLLWNKRYSSPDTFSDRPAALAVDSLGNVYVTGRSMLSGSNDFYTIKYTPDGTEAWGKAYHGVIDGDDYATGIALLDGSIVVIGASTGLTSAADYLTIKYLTNGDTVWTRRYAGPGDCNQGKCEDSARAVAVAPNGSVFVTGSSHQASGPIRTEFDIITVTYDATGATRWMRRHDGDLSLQDHGAAIAGNSGGEYM